MRGHALGARTRSRGLAVVAATVLASALTAAIALAAAGELDSSFNDNGKLTVDFGNIDDIANDVAIQANQRIVAVGWSRTTEGDDDFSLARIMPDGQLDNSFSGDGRRLIGFGNRNESEIAEGVAIQANGRIVVAGHTTDNAVVLARLKADGTLDPGFSGNGKQTIQFVKRRRSVGMDVVIQPDGRIVVAGHATSPRRGGRLGRRLGVRTQDDFGIARLRANGTLDPTFSGDGRRTISFGDRHDRANSLAILPGGSIVVAGFSERGGSRRADFALARLTPRGRLASRFAGDGRKVVDFRGGEVNYAEDVAIQSDGRIVAAGWTADFSMPPSISSRFAIARLRANGDLHQTFSGDGKQTIDFPSSDFDRAFGVAIQEDGRIVLAGEEGSLQFALARLDPDGSPDIGFDGDGLVTTIFQEFPSNAAAFDVAIQDDGGIVAAGTHLSGNPNDFALARYLSE